MRNPIVTVQRLSKTYNKKVIFRDLSFSIEEGTFTTLLGANGSGKSTLLRLISGSEFPDHGEVRFCGEEAHGWHLEHKRELFYINENIQIESHHTMEKFVRSFRELFPEWHEEFFRQMVRDRKLDLNRYYHQYSRGQKMQFNLIVPLAARPKLLLLDEITSVMDVYARRYFLGLLHRFCQSGRTVVMTTNIISELQYYTTHLLLIHEHRLKLNGALEEVRGGFVKLRFPAGLAHDLLKRSDLRWAGVNGDGSENYLLASSAGVQIPEEFVDRREITLEDIFVFHYADHAEEGAHADAA